jgi:hypothetical protein
LNDFSSEKEIISTPCYSLEAPAIPCPFFKTTVSKYPSFEGTTFESSLKD